MWFPTADQVIQMHDEILERSGGESGVLHRGAIEAAVERARWGSFRADDDLAERAAFLIRGIAQEHPFVDGNKRTAFEVAETFLSRNGSDLRASDGEIIALLLKVARGEADRDEIATWIREHVTKH